MNPHQLIKNSRNIKFNSKFSDLIAHLQYLKTHLPQKEAVVFCHQDRHTTQSYTYQQLGDLVIKTANFLALKIKLRPGQCLSLCLNNSPENVIINLASWIAGFAVSPLNLKADSVSTKIFKLTKNRSKVLIIRSDHFSDPAEITKIKNKLPKLNIIDLTNDFSLENLVSAESATPDFSPRQKNRGSLYLYTSGTTSLPKCAQLTYSSLLANAESIISWLKLDEKDRIYIVLPLHHINSTVFSLCQVLVGGTSIISSRYSATSFWSDLISYRATTSSIVPTIAFDLLQQPTAPLSEIQNLKIKRIQIGSAPVRATEVEQFYRRFKVRLVQGYGQTETSLRSTGIPWDVPFSKYIKLVRLNTIGTELKWTNVTVLDKNDRQVDANQEGEICVRGPIIMEKYRGLWKETRRSFSSGWFHSGDAGYYQTINNQRMFFLTGRIKELIIKGGVNISPLAVEKSIMRHFGAFISQVYAFPLPDNRYGQVVGIAYSVKNKIKKKIKDLAKDIITTCKNGLVEGVSRYCAPDYAFELTDADWPLNSTGKVMRVKIKEIIIEKLGLKS